MNDKELLEFAAKAAWGDFANQMLESGWHPLTDDGDALRLAVKLEISVLPGLDAASARNPSYTTWVNEGVSTDPYAATRRAIVRAAAAMGKSL